MLRLPKKDIIATCAVALAVVLYVLWLADAAVLGMSSTRVTGSAVLVLGFAASATAVVPGFDQLMHGNKLYLATTASLGMVALAAGIVMLWAASETALAVVVIVLVTLWAISTTHHAMLASADHERRTQQVEPTSAVDSGRHASVR